MKASLTLALLLGICLQALAQETVPLPGRLSLLDRDGDGRLSREEAGTRRFFRLADTNGDGFVTGAEAVALLRRKRGPEQEKADPSAGATENSGKPPYEQAADYSARNGGRAVIVMKHGKIEFERHDNGFGPDTATHLHSATKGFWGPAIAAMIEDGLIESFEELAGKTLPEWRDHPRKCRITLRHLLSLNAGLVQDVKNLQGHARPTLAPDLYRHAIGVWALREPGASFQYGPSCYYVLGEIMKRKLALRKQTPLDYLKQRILDPIGVKTGKWVHDASGNPHIPNGAHLTARAWIQYGQWLLQGGQWDGKQIVRKDLLAKLAEPSPTNAGHGLALWLNQPGGKGSRAAHSAPQGAKGGFIYHDGCTDIFAALGAGKCRMYVIPSLSMVALRQGDSKQDRFSDHTFLSLLLEPRQESSSAPETNAGDGTPWVTRAVRAPRVQHRVFDSAAAGSKVSYHVYLPPPYDREEGTRFPVLYWLHGRKGGLPGIAPMSRFFGTAMGQGRMPPAIIVFPNGLSGSMWCDSKDGRIPMETVVVKELIPHVDRTFRTVADRKGRMVEGFSMGGYGAARLGFKHPELFGAVSLLGAGPLQRVFSQDIGPAYLAGERRRVLQSVFGGDQAYFKALSPWVLAEKGKDVLRKGSLVRMAIGGLDGTLQFNRDFHEHLENLGVPHSFSVLPGVKHNALGVLTQLGGENWAFYRAALGARSATGTGTTRLLAVGKPTAVNPPEQQERARTAVRKVAAAARRFQPATVVDELAESVLTREQVRRDRVKLKVTGDIIRERLKRLGKTASPLDTVFIYTHSHGRKAGFEDSQPLGGMVMDLPMLHPRHRGTLLWDEYVDLFLAIPAKNVVVLTMSCFSGGLVEYLNSSGVRERWKDRWQKRGRNLVVLTSQSKDLQSPPIVKHGEVINPFTYAVARALAGEADGFVLEDGKPAQSLAKDGKLTVGEFIDHVLYVTENTASDFAGRRNIAKPQVTGSFGRDDVLFSGKKASARGVEDGRQEGNRSRRGLDRFKQLFERLDKDGDGMLTPAELGIPELFARLDTNGDGKLHLDEALKALASSSRKK